MAQSLSVTCAMQDINTVLIHPNAPQHEFSHWRHATIFSPALSDQLDFRPK
jgi:hypothetical protein